MTSCCFCVRIDTHEFFTCKNMSSLISEKLNEEKEKVSSS